MSSMGLVIEPLSRNAGLSDPINVDQGRELAPLLKVATPEVVREVYAEVVAEAVKRPFRVR